MPRYMSMEAIHDAVATHFAQAAGVSPTYLKREGCPRCKATGQELVFMHYDTCQLCKGAKTVSPDVAKADTRARAEERAKWSSK